MDSVFITAALNATFNVFETMAQFKPKPGIPMLKEDQFNYGDVTSVMHMHGNKATGMLAISFSQKSLFEIAQRMLGEQYTQVNEEICDLAGELTNMIVGGAKKTLAEEGYEFDMSTPNIFTGNDKPAECEFSGETVSLPFDTPAGKFYLELTYARPLAQISEPTSSLAC